MAPQAGRGRPSGQLAQCRPLASGLAHSCMEALAAVPFFPRRVRSLWEATGGLFIENAGNPQRVRASPSGGSRTGHLAPFRPGALPGAWEPG